MPTDTSLKLRRAILLYEDDGTALATVNDIHLDGLKRPLIGAGHCLTRGALDEMVRKMSGLPQRREILPARVLLADGARMAWYCPSARRPIFFKTHDAGFNRAVSGREALHPCLLFIAEAGRMAVFALAGDERPSAETPVFRAPYYNLYENGLMCAGNIRLPDVLQAGDLPTWEEAFFGTNFTHSNLHGRDMPLTSHPRRHAGLWWHLTSRSLRAFPSRYLVPLTEDKASLTLGELVNR
jgi:PRTRC genetic system protein B